MGSHRFRPTLLAAALDSLFSSPPQAVCELCANSLSNGIAANAKGDYVQAEWVNSKRTPGRVFLMHDIDRAVTFEGTGSETRYLTLQ